MTHLRFITLRVKLHSVATHLTAQRSPIKPTTRMSSGWFPEVRIPRLKEEADALIAENWSDVELVAAELIRRGRLTGAEVKAIVHLR